MKQSRNQSQRVNMFVALQLASACGLAWCASWGEPCWGQSAPPGAAGRPGEPRVISLQPPPAAQAKSQLSTQTSTQPASTAEPNKSSPVISTPAHVPLPVGVVSIANPQAASPQPAGESLIDGLDALIPPLPTKQLPAPQLPQVGLPDGTAAQLSGILALPSLPALPNAGPPISLGQATAAADSMPRMSLPGPSTAQHTAQYTAQYTAQAGGTPPAKSSLASHSKSLSGGGLTGFDLSAATSLEKNSFRASEPEEFPAGRLIAVVGYEHILAGDMAVFVEPIIQQNIDKIPSPEEEKKIRSQLTRQALRQYVEIKAIYHEFFRDMVGSVSPKEFAETKKKVVTRAGKIFFEKQVPVLMEKYEVHTIAELEQKLVDKSLSLATLRDQFIEQVLASELERKFVPEKFEIDRRDLVDAYQREKNSDRWNVAGRVRWRQLTVRFDKHGTREAAMARIRELGNEVYYGKAFEAVAKQSSEGYTASDGGNYDWTTQGSLKSKPLDQALFALPLNNLSQIIEDDIGLHIVEVLEREAGHVKDFTEAQAELRESLSEERRRKEILAFRERIMNRTTIWSLWPEDIPGSRPLSEALGEID